MKGTGNKKKVLAISLVCSILVVFAFVQVYKDRTASHPEGFHLVTVYLNETTKDNLTAVFFFDNNYTKHTDNSTLNQEFLNYFIQRLEVIRSQVLGIKAFHFSFYINDSNIYPKYDSSISYNFTAQYEACNNTVTLLLEEWYVLSAEVPIIG